MSKQKTKQQYKVYTKELFAIVDGYRAALKKAKSFEVATFWNEHDKPIIDIHLS